MAAGDTTVPARTLDMFIRAQRAVPLPVEEMAMLFLTVPNEGKYTREELMAVVLAEAVIRLAEQP